MEQKTTILKSLKFIVIILLTLFCRNTFGQDGSKFKVPLKKIHSKMYTKNLIKELSEIHGSAFVKKLEPKLISGVVNDKVPFLITFEDGNGNDIYDEIGTDFIGVYQVVNDSVYAHKSISRQSIAPITIIQVHNEFYKFELITQNQDYALISECVYCEAAKEFKPTIKLVDALPNINVELIDGQQLNLSSLVNKEGKYIYIEVWGAWCKPCLTILPELKRIYEEYGKKLTMVSLNFIDSKEEARKIIIEKNIKWINGFSTTAINDELLLLGYPYGILFDSSGRLIDSHVDVKQLVKFLSEN